MASFSERRPVHKVVRVSDLLLDVLIQDDVKGDKEVRPFMVVKEILWILTDYLVRKRLHQESGSGELTFFPDSRLAPVYGSAPITNEVFVSKTWDHVEEVDEGNPEPWFRTPHPSSFPR